MALTEKKLLRELKALGNPKIAAHSARFFKTGPGEYGEGDKFLGIRVPVIRGHLKKYRHELDLPLTVALLQNELHEVRLFAALAMLGLYKQAKDDKTRKPVVTQYLKHKRYLNSWDIVDGSAPGITGAWFFDKDRSRLHRMIKAKSLWDRRIAMLSTFYFIRQNDFDDTFDFASQLINDSEDLMHKASGWMLREAGKRDERRLRLFLDDNAAHMPRTMLRYSIEKLPQRCRKDYMARS